MTRKDYIIIADALADAKPAHVAYIDDNVWAARLATWEGTVASLMLALHKDNERFDPIRFADACGL